MIDVARIDHWAANGAGPMHRASPVAKLCFFACVVAAAVTARNPFALGAGYGTLIALAALASLPWLAIMVLSLYAAVFAVLYALSLRADAWIFALVLLKAVTPAFAVGMLIVSTPYPRIFAVLGRFLPEMLASGLFMTYRTFFILLDMMHNFRTAVRIRSGSSRGNIVQNIANISRGLAALLVHAIERSSHIYSVMIVRGYNGSMASLAVGGPTSYDWLPVLTGGAVLAVAAMWR